MKSFNHCKLTAWTTMLIASSVVSSSIVSSSSAHAQSLFERRSTNQIDQYRDYAARDVGDLLTVLINENTNLQNRDERSMDKSSNAGYDGALDYGFGGGLGSGTATGAIGTSKASSRGFSGDAEFRSARVFNDRFTVTVADVLPNGNLVIKGQRNISVQGDTRELMLSGIVRQYDILPGNSIPSHLVGNLQIQLKPKGPEHSFTKQGWLSKKFNRLWPF